MGIPRILVFGEVCKEISIYGCRDLDGIKYADNYEGEPSGFGVLSSMILSYYGNDVLLCSKVGADTDGKALIRYLSSVETREGERTDVRFITSSKDFRTPLHINIRTDNGDEKIICRSQLYSPTPSDVDDAFITYPDHVILFDGVDKNACVEISEQLGKKGGELYIMSCGNDSILNCFEKCAVLSVSNKEAEKLSGIHLKDQESCMRACMIIAKKIEMQYMVIRMGGRGYFIYDGTFYTFVPAYDLPRELLMEADPVFCSVFVHAFIESEGDIRYTCEYANAASAAYVARGKTSLPSDTEIKKFAERNGTVLE